MVGGARGEAGGEGGGGVALDVAASSIVARGGGGGGGDDEAAAPWRWRAMEKRAGEAATTEDAREDGEEGEEEATRASRERPRARCMDGDATPHPRILEV